MYCWFDLWEYLPRHFRNGWCIEVGLSKLKYLVTKLELLISQYSSNSSKVKLGVSQPTKYWSKKSKTLSWTKYSISHLLAINRQPRCSKNLLPILPTSSKTTNFFGHSHLPTDWFTNWFWMEIELGSFITKFETKLPSTKTVTTANPKQMPKENEPSRFFCIWVHGASTWTTTGVKLGVFKKIFPSSTAPRQQKARIRWQTITVEADSSSLRPEGNVLIWPLSGAVLVI